MPAHGVGVRVILDARKIDKLVAEVGGISAQRAAFTTRDRAKENLRKAGRVRTGHLVDSITARKITSTRNITRYSVGSDLFYAGFQEEGIGPVHARKGHVLRFQPKGSSVFIFRPRTKGFKGAHYLRDAYRALTARDFFRNWT